MPYRRGYHRAFASHPPPSRFLINGIDCHGAGGVYHAEADCCRGKRVFVSLSDGRYDSVAVDGSFPVRRKTFKSAQTLATWASVNNNTGKVFGPRGYGGDPIWTGGHGYPSVAQEKFVAYARERFGIETEWVNPPEGEATKGQYMDLIAVLYFLISPTRVNGRDEILAACDVIGRGANAVRDAVASCGVVSAYPFAKAVLVPDKPGSVLAENDFHPAGHPDRLVMTPEREFLATLSCDLRERLLAVK